MNRRRLLKLLSMGVIGYELDIDRLLWVPGQKTIFLPPIDIRYQPLALTLDEIIREWDTIVKPVLMKRIFESQYLYNRIQNQINDIQTEV